jgi:molybdopterin-synthase adenylyltransferase
MAHHLTRPDGEEDVALFLWRPSLGRSRATGVVTDVVLPLPSERHVHGNVSFEDEYFLRVATLAVDSRAGVGLIHSHPRASGWQGLSSDDFRAESSHSAQADVMTGLPMLGLTYATGNNRFSARFWERTEPKVYRPRDCESVRVVGGRYEPSYNPALRPAPEVRPAQIRTTSSWGEHVQADLARIRVGVIGVGSVGALIAEALARIGIIDLTLMDFDGVEPHNLDRLLHATRDDAATNRAKVEMLRSALPASSSAGSLSLDTSELSVVEPAGFELALDQDVLFCCVDRPWPRAALNLIAYSHLIPVVDGGVAIDVSKGHLKGAEWRAHVAAPGRKCLECLGQYDAADVAIERLGYLEDPSYIRNLEPDARRQFSGENVFNFSLAAAAAELNQFISMVVAPGGVADIGAQLFHFTTGDMDLDTGGCLPNCLYANDFLAGGDRVAIVVTGEHALAVRRREARRVL